MKKNTINTSITIAGVTFKNPIIAASGTFGFGREYSKLYDINVLGGFCTKGLTVELREGNAPPRIAETYMGILNSVGLQNPGIDAFVRDELPFLSGLDTIRIANVAGNTKEEYIEIVKGVSQASLSHCEERNDEAISRKKPIDMIELNISCPNVAAGGMSFGVCPTSVESIVSAVRPYAKLPMIVKLTPNVANIAENARAAESAGADAISLINTIAGMAVNYKTRKPILARGFGGLSGPAVKPIALKMTHDCYKAVKIPIIGMGGITTAEDIMEFMLCGATAVQVGTANFSNPNICFSLVKDLTNILKECNINDVREVIGALET